MNKIAGLDRMQAFVERFADVGIQSTSAEIVNFSGDLYNVQGSTEDPQQVPDHKGDSWKKLLIEFARLGGENCYVTNVVPPNDTSHPNFSVGGHMTTQRDGSVAVGADSYLMPLCSWHNSTARDEMNFTHSKDRMIKLSGYMEEELASTFVARFASTEPYALIYYDRSAGNWTHQNLSKQQALNADSTFGLGNSVSDAYSGHILIEKSHKTQPLCFIKEVSFPD